MKYRATTEQRAAAGRRGAKSRHGPSVIYTEDAGPIVLQHHAKAAGLTLERMNERIKSLRQRQQPLLLSLITAPLDERKRRASASRPRRKA